MVNVATMLDTIGTDALNIPKGTKFVGAYVSGTGDVPWDSEELTAFPQSVIIRIYQGAGMYPSVDGYDMIDVESEAVTIATCASEVEKRVQNGHIWTIVYGTDDTLSQCAAAIKALGENVWNGHVYSFLANWNLSAVEAEAILGTEVHGMTCVGVQYASPSSNPKTVTPGGSATLADTNLDISVVDASRLPLPPKVTAPPPGSTPATEGMVVYEATSGTYVSATVKSTDGGVTWSLVK